MQILKSFGDGIGTAAGVAWPTFGIVFGTLGLTVGGSSAIILGSISVGLFLSVLIPITYWSYRSYLKEQQELQQTTQQAEDRLGEFIFNYLLAVLRECLLNKEKENINDIDSFILVEYLKEKIFSDIAKVNANYTTQTIKILHKLLDDHQSNNFLYQFIKIASDKTNNTDSKILLLKNLNKIYQEAHVFIATPLSRFTLIKVGAIGFSAAFGSIAGCAAGTLGLLSAVGLFAGITTIPMIGWAILGSAAIFGLVIAGVCIYSTYKKNLMCQVISQYIVTNDGLENVTMIKNIKVDAEISAKRKYERQTSRNAIVNNPRKRSSSVNLTYSNNSHFIWRNFYSNQLQGTNTGSSFHMRKLSK